VQQHRQVAGRQRPQRHRRLVGPDGDAARAHASQDAAGAVGLGEGVRKAVPKGTPVHQSMFLDGLLARLRAWEAGGERPVAS
jgi:hypothetical protein